MAKKKETPLELVSRTRNTLKLYMAHGDVALRDTTMEQFMADLDEAFGYLMDFRNMVRQMSAFDRDPKSAARDCMDF